MECKAGLWLTWLNEMCGAENPGLPKVTGPKHRLSLIELLVNYEDTTE